MIKRLVMYFEQHLQSLYVLLVFVITLISCKSVNPEENHFGLTPVLHKVYRYSLIKMSAKHLLEKTLFDTARLIFSLENIHDTDKGATYKLTFNDFTLKRHPINVKIINRGGFRDVIQRNPFVILDSLGLLLHGRAVQVVINNKGIVEEVHGVDVLIKDISTIHNIDEALARNVLSDYVSSNAIKDFINRIFAVIPDKEVNTKDKWVRNIMLITKAPVKLSNLYTLEKHSGDTAYISIESIVSAAQSEGAPAYMKGKQNGYAIVSYSTGMPYLYETNTETVTTTSYDTVEDEEHFILKKL